MTTEVLPEADLPVSDPRGSIETITLGCRLNLYESEAMRNLAEDAGLSNVVLVNTCAVTGEAVRQARQTIRRARKQKPDALIVVTGCAAQIDPGMFAAMPEVDRVIGNAEKAEPKTFVALAGGQTERVLVNDIMSVRETAGHLIDGVQDRARAYVQVQNGCDHRCTFCIIPFGRGNSRSVPAGEVVAMIGRLVAKGVPEVVLSGVDMTSWGADLPGQPTLGDLVQRILKLVPDLKRLRLSSVDAVEIDDTLFRLFAEEERMMPHLHLSLQHGADMILKRMKRRHTRDDAIQLAARLRAARPDIAFGADLIAGFPTETEAHFADSLALVDEVGLAFLHVFPFSPRPETPAARMPQLDKATIKARAALLRDKGQQALATYLDSQIGTTQTVLIERDGKGRLNSFAEIQVPGGQAGALIQARVTGRADGYLLGELV
ncbi:MAG: tRNA (N(6)-L-threonylcarbamoyladenosine(37)-C(2))-methylthiotransferase MtaB [Hyphomonadaceae bacterium]|jgi:threonylcarbamoyladenosine tRNA methylthiotransferase MtaB|uniref:tRNA (N(6)-L-threonylcarbamoyladenosine(37)-C(2))- methylthiotransferase MtaB n=1 Tax=Aquidulcibacter sp. TaxID=2052990 RepID=UPI00078D8550|nr:tRNA (N(6)-L-threonylcarbamoyladenosine(37)-C(2))-methylthiotransferase MtaB [Aquidulcibacter sp.]AMS28492.1 2-methylthioadenine synthase [Hyphomonadaceae bacterium UKL13-1]MCE2891140.1 tRNA (N(6)-L-threonylcarbamoyladenosine(37)-C(2))-methylthiotransferase MtaB [Hyphomonadaceae bacterium]MCZ8209064.1 tRNA (N(6)-L-threonylcarbamoyladenosine(37)-C(2))-methylthiotransferase MtaB [Aquidulcibacter sp.]HCP65726.1 tRNA (N(6)-L-threonylcarbamoyladenosine(37)-C(2))-methylthiotransferase MtaB [Hyphom